MNSEKYVLSTEDYENIWLRFKHKSVAWVIGVVIATITILGFIVESHMDNIARELFSKRIAEPAFKAMIDDSLSNYVKVLESKLSFLESRYQQFRDSINPIIEHRDLPFELGTSSASFYDGKNRHFAIQYGHAVTGSYVTFSHPFAKNPAVFVSGAVDTLKKQVTPIHGLSRAWVYRGMRVDSVSTYGFHTQPATWRSRDIGGGGVLAEEFDWIAVGE